MKRRKEMRCSLAIAVVACLMLTANMAMGYSAVGEGWITGSWAQEFNETGVTFDHLQFEMAPVPGGTFETPGITGFNVPGWSQTFDDGITVLADGQSTTNNMNFFLNFTPAIETPLTFYFRAFNGATLVESVKASWSGSAWSFAEAPAVGRQDAPVPEPLTMASAFMAISSLGMYIRRRTKASV